MATFSLFNRFHRKIKSFFGGYIEHNHIDYQRLLVYEEAWDREQELEPLRQFLRDQTAKTWEKQIARAEKQKGRSMDR